MSKQIDTQSQDENGDDWRDIGHLIAGVLVGMVFVLLWLRFAVFLVGYGGGCDE